MSNEKSPMLLESQACYTHVTSSEDAWYANTIASQHMTNNKHRFWELKPIKLGVWRKKVVIDANIWVLGLKALRLSLYSSWCLGKGIVQNALYVQDLWKNMMSKGNDCQNGCWCLWQRYTKPYSKKDGDKLVMVKTKKGQL